MDLSFIGRVRKSRVGNYITIPKQTAELIEKDKKVKIIISEVENG